MSKKTKDKDKDKTDEPERSSLVGASVIVRVVLVLAAALAAGAGIYLLRERLLASPSYAERFARVRLAEPPAWLPAGIADKITADLQAVVKGRNVFDDNLARDVYLAAADNAWIVKVHSVTKHHDGSVVVNVEFRRPFALVATEDAPGVFHVIDAAGVILPLSASRVKPGSFIAIDGVVTAPPETGKKWDVPDLADGLQLLELIKDKPYIREVTTIDVRNHNGRFNSAEPHLRMYAQVGRGARTDIRFGRFSAADGLDYCVPAERKLEYLDEYFRRNGGRVAGIHDYIDLRYDRLRFGNR